LSSVGRSGGTWAAVTLGAQSGMTEVTPDHERGQLLTSPAQQRVVARPDRGGS